MAQAYFISATDRHYLTSDYGSTTKLLKTPVYLDAALGMHALQPHPKHLEWLLVVGRKISDTIVDIVNYFAATEHIRIFTNGLIDSRPIIYYLSMSLLFLSFTHHVLEFRRWRP